MTPARDRDVTTLLQSWARGDGADLDRLLPLIYRELRAQTKRAMRSQPLGHTLQTTAQVHEASLRLVDAPAADWPSRAHIPGMAAALPRLAELDPRQARVVEVARPWLRRELGGGERGETAARRG